MTKRTLSFEAVHDWAERLRLIPMKKCYQVKEHLDMKTLPETTQKGSGRFPIKVHSSPFTPI